MPHTVICAPLYVISAVGKRDGAGEERRDEFIRQDFIDVIKHLLDLKQQLNFSGIMLHPQTCTHLGHGRFAAWFKLKTIYI